MAGFLIINGSPTEFHIDEREHIIQTQAAMLKQYYEGKIDSVHLQVDGDELITVQFSYPTYCTQSTVQHFFGEIAMMMFMNCTKVRRL